MKKLVENQISYDIRGAALHVHKNLGPGLLESVYEQALAYELAKMGYTVMRQVGVPMKYKNIRFDIGFRLDILVNDLVIIEIKSVEYLAAVHYKQLQTYLRLSEKKLGLLINFNSVRIKDAIERVVNNLF